MKRSELWARIWPLVLVLLVTIGGWFVLSYLAFGVRAEGPDEIAKGLIAADFDKARDWAKDLLGIAAVFAGFLGVAKASQRVESASTGGEQLVAGGMIGILAGSTLLGVGGWPVPAALAAVVAGSATERVVRILREEKQPPREPA